MQNRNPGIRRLFPEETRKVARLHYELFGDQKKHGNSIATFGEHFLRNAFYGANIGNPYFHCDVAVDGGDVVGFSVYTNDNNKVFKWTLKYSPVLVGSSVARLAATRPSDMPRLLDNMRYIEGEELPVPVQGNWMVAGVRPDYRQYGVASRMAKVMEVNMYDTGCTSYLSVVDPNNTAIIKFHEKRGLEKIGERESQGRHMLYYARFIKPEEMEIDNPNFCGPLTLRDMFF